MQCVCLCVGDVDFEEDTVDMIVNNVCGSYHFFSVLSVSGISFAETSEHDWVAGAKVILSVMDVEIEDEEATAGKCKRCDDEVLTGP